MGIEHSALVMLGALRTATRRAQPSLANAVVSRSMPSVMQTRAFASFLDSKEVEERVLNVLKSFEKVDAGKLAPTAHFKNDLGLDSLDTVEVVMAVEEEFAIEIPDAEAEKIQSCDEAIKYVAAHPQAK